MIRRQENLQLSLEHSMVGSVVELEGVTQVNLNLTGSKVGVTFNKLY
jgi:hypothetical protein